MNTQPKSAKPQVAAMIPKNALKPVKVTLTVTKFVDVLKSRARGGARNTKCKMKIANHPDAWMTKGIKGGPPRLNIAKGGATICFWIKSADPGYNYFPLGIAFKRWKDSAPRNKKKDTLGRTNFSFASMHLYGRSLYITDNFNDCGADDRYKFSVIIQRQHDGAIGIIDPPLDHDPAKPPIQG